MTGAPAPRELLAARRRLLLDGAGIAASAIGFGLVYGLSARQAGFSPIEATAMSVIVFAGASQFAAVGYVAAGLPWPGVIVLTFFLNARHLLYSASLAPRLRGLPFAERAAMAHVLTDEAFALAAAHFARLGRADVPGYWIGAVGAVFIPWNVATLAGMALGSAVPDPNRLGLDVVFPAAMAGLSVGLVAGRREVVAAGSGAAIGVVGSLLVGPAIGIIAGGLIGPLLGMAVPGPVAHRHAGSPMPLGEPDLLERAGHQAEVERSRAALPPTHPEPPMPFGRIDIERALEDAGNQAGAPPPSGAPPPTGASGGGEPGDPS